MKHLFTFAVTALVALLSFAPNTATAQATEPVDTIELRFKSFYEDHPQYLDSEEWIITVKNDIYQFNFIFKGNPNDPSGTYTEEDLDLYFSWCDWKGAEGTNYYKKCKLTIKKEKLGQSLCKYILDADIVTTTGLGENKPVSGVFKIHAEHEVIIPVKRYDEVVYFSSLDLLESGFRLYGKNDTMDVDMTFKTIGGVSQQITHKMLDATKTKLVRLGTAYEVISMEGVTTPQPNIYDNVTYVAMMEIVAGCAIDTVMINLAMEAPVTPVKTVDVFCQNLFIDKSRAAESVITLLASNDEYSIEIGCNDKVVRDSATYSGTMGAGSIIKDIDRDITLSGLSTTVTLIGSKAKGYTATARVFSEEHVCYNILLTNIIEPIDTVNIQFNNNSKAMFDIDELGLHELQLAGYNMNYSVAFDILNIDRILVTEEFELADLFLDNNASFLIKHSPEGDKDVEFIQVHGSIKQRNDSTFLNAIVHGLDSTLYNISMFYTVPTPTDTLEFTFKEDLTEFINALPQNTFILKGFTDDAQVMCNIQVNRTSSVEGTFICDGQFEENQFEPFETYVGILKNASKMEYEAHYMQQGEMTLTVDDKGVAHATAKFICDDAILYILKFEFTYTRPRLPFDAQGEGVDFTYTGEAIVSVGDYIATNNRFYMDILPTDYSSVAQLCFIIEETDAQTIVPAGTYPIKALSTPAVLNSVVACPGVSAQDYTPLPSSYCKLSPEGYFVEEECYFLVDGTVTVANADGKLKLDVDAVNSYDLPVKLHYLVTPTDVENVETTPGNSVKKIIVNGQLLIIRNGETYTITGAKL